MRYRLMGSCGFQASWHHNAYAVSHHAPQIEYNLSELQIDHEIRCQFYNCTARPPKCLLTSCLTFGAWLTPASCAAHSML